MCVTGSRKFKNLKLVDEYLYNELYLHHKFALGTPLEFSILTGGAVGVDQRAMDWCTDNQIQVRTIYPLNMADKMSYLFRNIELVTLADEVVAFWDGESKGTKFTFEYAASRGKRVYIQYEDGELETYSIGV